MVSKATVGLVREACPEAIIPLSRLPETFKLPEFFKMAITAMTAKAKTTGEGKRFGQEVAKAIDEHVSVPMMRAAQKLTQFTDRLPGMQSRLRVEPLRPRLVEPSVMGVKAAPLAPSGVDKVEANKIDKVEVNVYVSEQAFSDKSQAKVMSAEVAQILGAEVARRFSARDVPYNLSVGIIADRKVPSALRSRTENR